MACQGKAGKLIDIDFITRAIWNPVFDSPIDCHVTASLVVVNLSFLLGTWEKSLHYFFLSGDKLSGGDRNFTVTVIVVFSSKEYVIDKSINHGKRILSR